MTIWIDANALVDAFERSSIWGWSTEQDQTAHKWALDVIEGFLNDTQPSTDGDLISRESALAEFRDGRDVYDIMESIEELPSAPDSRQYGEWIFEPKDAIELMFTKPKCSECGFESADGGNFCSNCGADMRGGEDDADE